MVEASDDEGISIPIRLLTEQAERQWDEAIRRAKAAGMDIAGAFQGSMETASRGVQGLAGSVEGAGAATQTAAGQFAQMAGALIGPLGAIAAFGALSAAGRALVDALTANSKAVAELVGETDKLIDKIAQAAAARAFDRENAALSPVTRKVKREVQELEDALSSLETKAAAMRRSRADVLSADTGNVLPAESLDAAAGAQLYQSSAAYQKLIAEIEKNQAALTTRRKEFGDLSTADARKTQQDQIRDEQRFQLELAAIQAQGYRGREQLRQEHERNLQRIKLQENDPVRVKQMQDAESDAYGRGLAEFDRKQADQVNAQNARRGEIIERAHQQERAAEVAAQERSLQAHRLYVFSAETQGNEHRARELVHLEDHYRKILQGYRDDEIEPVLAAQDEFHQRKLTKLAQWADQDLAVAIAAADKENKQRHLLENFNLTGRLDTATELSRLEDHYRQLVAAAGTNIELLLKMWDDYTRRKAEITQKGNVSERYLQQQALDFTKQSLMVAAGPLLAGFDSLLSRSSAVESAMERTRQARAAEASVAVQQAQRDVANARTTNELVSAKNRLTVAERAAADAARQSGDDTGAAVMAAAQNTMRAIAMMAAQKALWELAEAAAMAALSYFGWTAPAAIPSAADHLKAAALYGVVAGSAGAVAVGLGATRGMTGDEKRSVDGASGSGGYGGSNESLGSRGAGGAGGGGEKIIRETVILIGDAFESPQETARRAARTLRLARELDLSMGRNS